MNPNVSIEKIKLIKSRIRKNCSPKHVPSIIIKVPEIPRTKSGKIVELAVRQVVNGEKINNKEFIVKKLSTENKELYGSVKPTEISKIIKEKEHLDIKPSMIQPVKEIKSLGKFKVKISLHSEIDAEILIVVESAETIQ